MPAINPFILNKGNFRTARSIAYKNGISSVYELSTLDMASVEHLEVHLCQKSLYRKSRRYMSNYTKSSGVKPFYQATKRLFGGHPKRKVALRLDSFKPLDLEHVEWSNVAILDLAEPSLDVLFALALKLPNLSRLVSRYVSLDIYSLDRAAVVVRGVEKQNKKLRSVRLFEPRPAPEEMLSRAVDQLLEAFQLHSVEFLSIFDEFINIANAVFVWKNVLYAETEFRAGKTE
ncbi:hypothetical protein H4S01_000212 [Coemansia sp. RSA 2610]|nr:hypothetical protein H4S01_000212 [Coemansia sp. RSA 2610]